MHKGARTLEQPMATDEREYLLKVLQVWLDAKHKIASIVLLANGATLATALAFIKEEGSNAEGVFAFRASGFGIYFGALAFISVWGYSDSIFERLFRHLHNPEATIDTNTVALKRINTIFYILTTLSGVCFLACVAYLSRIL